MESTFLKEPFISGRSRQQFKQSEATSMGNPDNDLWSEFSEKEGVTDDFTGKLPPLPKTSGTDGSEWTGKFDRRSTSRNESLDDDSGEESAS